MFDTLMVFQKEFFEKSDFEKKSADNEKHAKFPSMHLSDVSFQVAEVTFNFWHKLSEELYQRNKADLNDIFKPYIQRLIIALCRHCQMDPDHVRYCSLTYSE